MSSLTNSVHPASASVGSGTLNTRVGHPSPGSGMTGHAIPGPPRRSNHQLAFRPASSAVRVSFALPDDQTGDDVDRVLALNIDQAHHHRRHLRQSAGMEAPTSPPTSGKEERPTTTTEPSTPTPTTKSSSPATASAPKTEQSTRRAHKRRATDSDESSAVGSPPPPKKTPSSPTSTTPSSTPARASATKTPSPITLRNFELMATPVLFGFDPMEDFDRMSPEGWKRGWMPPSTDLSHIVGPCPLPAPPPQPIVPPAMAPPGNWRLIRPQPRLQLPDLAQFGSDENPFAEAGPFAAPLLQLGTPPHRRRRASDSSSSPDPKRSREDHEDKVELNLTTESATPPPPAAVSASPSPPRRRRAASTDAESSPPKRSRTSDDEDEVELSLNPNTATPPPPPSPAAPASPPPRRRRSSSSEPDPSSPSSSDEEDELEDKITEHLALIATKLADIQGHCEARTGQPALLDAQMGLQRNRTTLLRLQKVPSAQRGLAFERSLDQAVARIVRFADMIQPPPPPAPRLRRQAGRYRR